MIRTESQWSKICQTNMRWYSIFVKPGVFQKGKFRFRRQNKKALSQKTRKKCHKSALTKDLATLFPLKSITKGMGSTDTFRFNIVNVNNQLGFLVQAVELSRECHIQVLWISIWTSTRTKTENMFAFIVVMKNLTKCCSSTIVVCTLTQPMWWNLSLPTIWE